MDKNLYSIKIDKSGRYIRHCDEHWYETCEFEFRFFTKEQALKIREQLRKHYVYSVTISNGKEVIPTESPLKEKKAQPVTAAICIDEGSDWGGNLTW